MARRRNKQQWQQLINDQQRSGLSQKAFCRQQGIAVATFGYWKRKLQPVLEATKQQSGAGAPWLELSHLPPPSRDDAEIDRAVDWQIELELGHGVYLRLKSAG